MGFEFHWYDEAQTVMCYAAEGDWNWRDYHACARASVFSMHKHPHPVHVLIDLRGSTRDRLPGGLLPHVRTFGKKLAPAQSGRAIVIGLTQEAEAKIGVDEQRQLVTPDGFVQFVDTEADLEALLQAWSE